jgi:MFS transporter, PAT family, beta-lactamase induction signal transducer AmpG
MGSPWRWVPSLYFAQGAPYVVVVTVSTLMFKDLGLSNTDLALYTSWLYLPWVLKPLWSPVVDLWGTKRRWVVATQATVAIGLALLAAALPTPGFVVTSLLAMSAMALASATHDVAADGLYMLALPPHQQAAFAGIRSTAYRLATILGEGQLVVLAGYLGKRWSDPAAGWSGAMAAAAVVFGLLVLLHAWLLPSVPEDRPTGDSSFLREFGASFATFFQKPEIARALPFFLLYRFAEAHLMKMMGPFLLDPRADGGLGLAVADVGLAKGTFGAMALVLGGILGGVAISRHGLRSWLWPMVAILHLPDLVFVGFAWFQPTSWAVICGGIVLEQFGYGFGFTAYMLYMIWFADGPRKTTHYAIATGFMALGMMVPGAWSGWLADQLGWRWFFVFVAMATVPGFAATAMVRVPPEFGRKAPVSP